MSREKIRQQAFQRQQQQANIARQQRQMVRKIAGHKSAIAGGRTIDNKVKIIFPDGGTANTDLTFNASYQPGSAYPVSQAANGKTYLHNRSHVEPVADDETPTAKTPTLKILFFDPDDNGLYVGGDRAEPSLIATLPAGAAIETARIDSTGEEEEDWIVSVQYVLSAASVPDTPPGIPALPATFSTYYYASGNDKVTAVFYGNEALGSDWSLTRGTEEKSIMTRPTGYGKFVSFTKFSATYDGLYNNPPYTPTYPPDAYSQPLPDLPPGGSPDPGDLTVPPLPDLPPPTDTRCFRWWHNNSWSTPPGSETYGGDIICDSPEEPFGYETENNSSDFWVSVTTYLTKGGARIGIWSYVWAYWSTPSDWYLNGRDFYASGADVSWLEPVDLPVSPNFAKPSDEYNIASAFDVNEMGWHYKKSGGFAVKFDETQITGDNDIVAINLTLATPSFLSATTEWDLIDETQVVVDGTIKSYFLKDGSVSSEHSGSVSGSADLEADTSSYSASGTVVIDELTTKSFSLSVSGDPNDPSITGTNYGTVLTGIGEGLTLYMRDDFNTGSYPSRARYFYKEGADEIEITNPSAKTQLSTITATNKRFMTLLPSKVFIAPSTDFDWINNSEVAIAVIDATNNSFVENYEIAEYEAVRGSVLSASYYEG